MGRDRRAHGSIHCDIHECLPPQRRLRTTNTASNALSIITWQCTFIHYHIVLYWIQVVVVVVVVVVSSSSSSSSSIDSTIVVVSSSSGISIIVVVLAV